MSVKQYNKEAPAQPDTVTGSLSVIDSDHHMVHRYAMYTICHYNLAVANDGTVTIGFEVPSDMEVHIKQFGVVGNDFPWIFDAVSFTTYTESATFLTPINHHVSTISHPSRVIVNVDPTDLPAEGDYKVLFGGGSGVGASSNAGGFTPSTEYIMHSGKHIIRATNKTGGTQEYSIVFTWYEIDLT